MLKKKTSKLVGILMVFPLTLALMGCETKKEKKQAQYKQTYSKLISEMGNFSKKSSDIITSLLFDLPEDYENTLYISNTFRSVKKYTDDINAAENLSEMKSEKARAAYIKLMNIQESNYNWNFYAYFDEMAYVMFLGVKWDVTCDDGEEKVYSLSWLPDLFYSNLPSNKDPEKDYFFDTSYISGGVIFSYCLDDDNSNYFESFKVYDFTYKNKYFIAKLFNYSNIEIYNMAYYYGGH